MRIIKSGITATLNLITSPCIIIKLKLIYIEGSPFTEVIQEIRLRKSNLLVNFGMLITCSRVYYVDKDAQYCLTSFNNYDPPFSIM